MDDRIAINGIAYVKEQQPPNCVKFYFMHDGFRFSRLKGNLLQEIAIEALHMICHNLGCIAAGDPDHADSWHDIAEYAQLVANRLSGVQR